MLPRFTTVVVNRGNVIQVGPSSGYTCRGNLVRNGGFEEGLKHWLASNVRIVTGKEPHEGKRAAGLGARRRNRRRSRLWQDVPIPSGVPCQYFQIIFYVAGYKKAPARLLFTAEWLNGQKEVLGMGARARIQRRAIGNGSRGEWTPYNLITGEAPSDAAFLRLLFTKRPGPKKTNFLTLDDVVVVRVPGV